MIIANREIAMITYPKALRLFLFLPAVMLLVTGVQSVSHADESTEKIIKARQGYYQMVRHNAGILFGMAKGNIEYDAAAASSAANNLLALSKLDTGNLWPAGTSKEEMPGKTRALKKIWDTYPDIVEKSNAWKQAVADMASEAGEGLEAVQFWAGELGGGCKGCHDNFRAKDF